MPGDQFGPQIRVNCNSPGWIEVRRLEKAGHAQRRNRAISTVSNIQVGRVGVPNDIAAMVAFADFNRDRFITTKTSF
jgi:NAD(P)-dependent dehydrogenase (short-subunit alcohol dehydrogenase family)